MKKGELFHASFALDNVGPAQPGRPQVLVVDDDDDLRGAVADILRGEGLSVVAAPNGSAALDYLLGTPTRPSLILLDMNMPIMSGPEMLRVLQGYVRLSTIPVVVVTSEIPAAGALAEGTVGRLQKPFGARKLLALVRQHIGPAR